MVKWFKTQSLKLLTIKIFCVLGAFLEMEFEVHTDTRAGLGCY